eukprot:Gb_04259 [translate_table: standard]
MGLSDAESSTVDTPLLFNNDIGGDKGGNTTTKILHYSLSTTSNFVKMLPTGVVFMFQTLSNLLSNEGDCGKGNKVLTGVFLGILGIACFISSFTDTFEDNGKVHYGIATTTGLATLTHKNKKQKRKDSACKLNWKDWMHATLAVVVYAVMVLSDKTVVQCLYPSAQSKINKLVQALPLAVAFATSALFAIFPSTRQGTSHPVTTNSKEASIPSGTVSKICSL